MKRLIPTYRRNKEGIVLIVSLLVLFAISLLMVVAVKSITMDIQIATNYKNNIKAFYDAEAGVHYGIKKMELAWQNKNVMDFKNFNFDTSYQSPTSFLFQLNSFKLVSGNKYRFRSIGYAENTKKEGRSIIEVKFRSRIATVHPINNDGFFADKLFEFKSTAGAYGFNSEEFPNPDASDPNMVLLPCNVLSNQLVSVFNDSNIEGAAVIGKYDLAPNVPVDGTVQCFPVSDDPNSRFSEGVRYKGERIDPDPIGSELLGTVYELIKQYETKNDNAKINQRNGWEVIGADNIVNIKDKKLSGLSDPENWVAIPPGNYYFEEFSIGQGIGVTIDTDPTNPNTSVNFYIHESGTKPVISISAGSVVNIIGKSTSFSIFSDADTPNTNNIEVKHLGDLKGMLYAPYAKCLIHNEGDVMGSIWVGEAYLQNSGKVWYDSMIKNTLTVKKNGDLKMTSWKELISAYDLAIASDPNS